MVSQFGTQERTQVVAPAELGWGTHEKLLPPNAYEHKTGPKNQILMAQPGAIPSS